MFAKATQRKLALYFSAMIALHGNVLWQARRSIPQGLPDFSIFYTAGKIVRDGQGHRLYDDALQEAVQRSFSPRAVERRGTILPYNHPAFEALPFVALARFSYLSAYGIWLGVNLALLGSIPFLLRRRLGRLGKAPLHLWLLGGFAFFPIFIALIQGQDSILLLFLYCLAFAGLERASELATGSWLGLGLYKYHLVMPFALPLCWRKKLLAGFLSVALILGLISWAVTGWQGLLAYPGYVRATEQDTKYVWNSPHGNTANLRGLISAMVPVAHPEIRTGLIVLLSAVVLLLMIYAARTASWADDRSRQAVISLNLVGTILVSYHIYVHDLSILFLALVLTAELLLSDPPLPDGVRRVLYASIAVLFCSPVYLVLTLRFRQLQVMAAVLLLVFLGLLSVLRALRLPPATTGPLPASPGG